MYLTENTVNIIQTSRSIIRNAKVTVHCEITWNRLSGGNAVLLVVRWVVLTVTTVI